MNRRRLRSLAAAAATTPVALQLARSQVKAPSSSNQFVFPGLQWEATRPEELAGRFRGSLRPIDFSLPYHLLALS